MGNQLKDKLAKRRKEMSERGSGGPFLTFREGKTRIRHLPVGEEVDWAIEVVYFYLGGKIKGYISPKTFGKKCAVWEEWNKLSNSKKAEDREFAKKMRPKRKYMSVVARYKDEDGKEIDTDLGPKLALLPDSAYQDALDLYLDEKEAGDFTDMETGYDLKYQRTGKGLLDTEYSTIKCKETPLHKHFRKLFKADPDVFNPEAAVKKLIPTYEESKQILQDFLNTPEEEEEKPEKDTKKKKKKKKDL